MPLKKPIRAIFRYILSPQFEDFCEDEEEAIANSISQHFQALLAQIDRSTYDLQLFGISESLGTLQLQVSDLTQSDFQYISRHNPFPLMWGDSIALTFIAEWSEPQNIADLNRHMGFSADRKSVQQHCVNILDDIAKKFLVLMSVYLPGSSKSLFSYSNAPYGGLSNLACVSHMAYASLKLARANVAVIPPISFSEMVAWSLGSGPVKSLAKAVVG